MHVLYLYWFFLFPFLLPGCFILFSALGLLRFIHRQCYTVCKNADDSEISENLTFNFYIPRLAYLHEGLEPKVVHRDIKASNILLDQQWNARVSDFGLAKLLWSEKSYVTTRVMGTFGLVVRALPSSSLLILLQTELDRSCRY